MYGTGQVIQLMPGGGGQMRRDWSPIAQPPDKHDVIAHTPDPNAYHSTGGRTMIPRHSGQFGGSRGFSTKPGVVNVDPTDPLTGQGGITVDLEAVSKADYAYAADVAQGNPLMAWSVAASRQKRASAQPASPAAQAFVQAFSPQAPGGYVTPHTDPSGGIIPHTDAADPLAPYISPVQGVAGSVMPLAPVASAIANPAVKPRKPDMHSMPQTLPSSWEGGAPAPAPVSPVLGATHPSQLQHAQAPQVAPPQHPHQQQPQQPQAPQLQHGQVQYFHGQPYSYNAHTNAWDVYQPPRQAPVDPPAPQPAMPPAPAPAAIPGDVLTDTLKLILTELKDLKGGPTKQAAAKPSPVVEEESFAWENERRRRVQEEEHQAAVADAQAAHAYAELKMPWLGHEPAPPRMQVIFQMPNGMLRTRYHFASRRGICLSLIYDSRYDGDQFIPSNTPEGETIRVQIPFLKLDVEAIVMDYHNAVGCLDIVNLILVDRDRMDGPPIMTDDVEEEIHSLSRRGVL